MSSFRLVYCALNDVTRVTMFVCHCCSQAKTLHTISVAVSLVTSLPLDLSRYIPDVFASVIITSASSVKDEIRTAIVPLAAAVVAKCR